MMIETKPQPHECLKITSNRKVSQFTPKFVSLTNFS